MPTYMALTRFLSSHKEIKLNAYLKMKSKKKEEKNQTQNENEQQMYILLVVQ